MTGLKLTALFIMVLFGAYASRQARLDSRKLVKKKTDIASAHSVAGVDSAFMQSVTKNDSTGVDGYFLGSVVVLDGRVIGEGRNRADELNDPSGHSDIEAIRAAFAKLGGTDLSGSTLYSAVRPCPTCLSLACITGIERIFYGFEATTEDLKDAGNDTPMAKEICAELIEASLYQLTPGIIPGTPDARQLPEKGKVDY